MAGVLIGFASYSQTVTDVVTVDSTLKKQTLYSNALSFFAVEFKSANNVIQMKDAETGKVIGKGIVDDREIVVTITCKDGKYKYDIDIVPRTDIVIDVDFDIKKYSSYYLNGTTTGKLIFVDGKPTLPTNTITYYSGTGTMGSAAFTMYYDGVGKPLLTNGAYMKWKDEVDSKIKSKLLENEKISDPNTEFNKKIINGFIADLKTIMSKKSDF